MATQKSMIIRDLKRVGTFLVDHHDWDKPRDLTCVHMLDKGNLSEIWKASRDDIKDQDGNPVFYAAKVFAKGKKNPYEAVFKEVRIMRRVRHKNILEFIVLYANDDFFVAITELANGGSLAKFIKTYSPIKKKDAAYIIKQILNALEHMHEDNVMHINLTPENILFKNRVEYDPETGLNENRILLCDFGSAVESKTSRLGTFTPNYTAPEILKGKEPTTKVDMWAVGIITYEMLHGERPFTIPELVDPKYKEDTKKWKKHLDAVLDLNSAKLMSMSIFSDAMDFICKCLVRKASWRMSARQALQHEWIRPENSKLKQGVNAVSGLLTGGSHQKGTRTNTSKSAKRKYKIKSHDDMAGESTEKLIS